MDFYFFILYQGVEGVRIYVSRFEVDKTHYGGKLKTVLDARMDISKMWDLFQVEHLRKEMKLGTTFTSRTSNKIFIFFL